jgi:TPR repeat protein
VPPTPVAPAPEPATPPLPPPPRVETKPGTDRLPLILLGLLLLALAVAAGWWFLGRQQEEPRPQPAQQQAAPQPQQPAQPAAPPQPQRPAAPPAPVWPDGTDGLSLREVVERAPNAQALHAVALRRQQAGRHDDSLVLYEEAAEKGHAPAMTALARLYDPNGFRPGQPFRSPDPRAAARYYRDAAQRGDAAADAPRAALKAWLEEQAPRNQSAADALKEFWP